MASKRGLGRGIAALLSDGESAGQTADAGRDAVTITDRELAETVARAKSANLAAANPAAASADNAGHAERVPHTGADPRVNADIIALDKLRANPDQPRRDFKQDELEELSRSIHEHGIIQPVIVEDSGDGTFTIIAGERRVRAARMAGLTEAPVIVRKYSDEKRMAVALIENVQRSDLNPIEEAAAYKQLMELTGLSQDETALRVGKNRSTVANALRLLKLPVEIKESIRKGEVSAGHARALLSVADAKAQDFLYRDILAKGLSVREAERLAAQSDTRQKKGRKQPQPKERAPELSAMEDRFLERLGTRVKLNGTLSKGTIVIDYYSMEDLDRLYNLIATQ